MLRREGHLDNVKRVYGLYREAGLSLRLKCPRRNKAAKWRQPKQLCAAVNEHWSMDFVADALFDVRKLRVLTSGSADTRRESFAPGIPPLNARWRRIPAPKQTRRATGAVGWLL